MEILHALQATSALLRKRIIPRLIPKGTIFTLSLHIVCFSPRMHVRPLRPKSAFTLVELLTVMAIILILAVALLPAVTGITTAGRLTTTAANIASILEQARTYAMGNNTYVYLGLQEVDEVTPTAHDGVGRVVIAVVASRDGSRPYTTGPLTASDLGAISKLQPFDNAHLVSASSLMNGTGMTSRPAASVDLSSTTATTTFQWPLTGTAQNNFTKVIEFDPQGMARVQTGTGYNPTAQAYIEISLVGSNGDVAAAKSSNQAAVQVDGITGSVRVYRP